MPSYIGNPPAQVIELDDNEVTTSKINDLAVTNAKLAGSIANAKLSNSSITINGTAISLGASGDIVAGLDWQSVKTTAFTAVSQEGYAVNTTGGAIIVTLPASPSAGDNIAIVDYAGTFNSNNCTINPNGNKIEGSTSNQVLQTNRVAINLTYIDSTQGWLVTSEGSSTPITAPVISWDTSAGTVGTITDAQRSGGYSLSSCGGSANVGTPTFSITSGALPTGLSMSSSGAISGTVTNPVGSDTVFSFTVTASISAIGYTETRAFTVTVNSPIITFNTAAGTIGTVIDANRSNGSYSLSAVTATTTTGSLTYAVTSGALPGSVALNSSTGAITGNFDVVGSNTTTTFTITATETVSSKTAAREFSITVNAPIITFATASGSIGTVDNADRSNGSYTLSAVTATVTSGSLTYAVTTGSLPSSVALNSSTGAITGDFDQVGSDTTTTFTITATEGTSSVTAAREFSITVNAPVNVSYLLVAGGAGGGSGNHFFGAGGGGAGGLLTGTISAASGNYTVSIGGGGGGAGGVARGGNGGNSSISGVATATGGGGGAAVSSGAGGNKHGASGGSGGGGGHDSGSGNGGSGTSGQGNNGGNGQQDGGGGGGGGKGSAGSSGGGSGGAGGTGGQYSTIASGSSSGDNGYYAAGGSGGNNSTSRDGGGGASGSSGQANTGGGGGKQAGGGSGICIMYYTASSQQATGGTVSNSGGVYYHKFTSGGTFSI